MIPAERQTGLYVHLPWCVRKCPYCDFNSHGLRGELPERAYVCALLADLEQDLALAPGTQFATIFLGGGTPSLFSPEAIAALLEGVRRLAPVRADAEVTLEANPGTVEQARFSGYRRAGVNRLSLGIQSLQDDLLRRLGRIHDAAQARSAVQAARRAGFDNLNLDLMFGLPGQSTAQALDDLHQALALEPAHLSWYQLTIEPNTLFYAHPPALPDEDSLWRMQMQGGKVLGEAGYRQYEVSAWCRNRACCRHNVNYWRFGDYVGIGAGAHGKLTRNGHIRRTHKLRHPTAWMREAAGPGRLQEIRRVEPADCVFEFALNRLRLTAGFRCAEFAGATGLDAALLEAPMAQARRLGLLRARGEVWTVTPRGRRFLNDLQALFLPEVPVQKAARLDAGRGLA